VNALRLRTFNLITALLIATVVIYLDPAPRHAQTKGPISIIAQSTKSVFRKSMTFTLKAKSTAGQIVSVRLFTRLPNQTQENIASVNGISPTREISAELVWDTQQSSIPPWLLMRYQWELKDSAGNVFKTPLATAEFKDDTRAWVKLSDGKVAVFYYQQSQKFGKDLFSAAQKAYKYIAKATGHTPFTEIRVVVFNNQDDFCAFHAANNCVQWAWGETHPGITAQWIDSVRDPSRRYLLGEAIPHELAHAFLREWAGVRLSDIPAWFDEGQAVNNQLVGIDDYVERARRLAKANKLRRINAMGLLTQIPPDNLDMIADWYAQSTSMVYYLYKQWGTESLGKLINHMIYGDTFNNAWKKVTGLTLDEFEVRWRKWVGATGPLPTLRPTPTVP
jgi:hypothetical protein